MLTNTCCAAKWQGSYMTGHTHRRIKGGRKGKSEMCSTWPQVDITSSQTRSCIVTVCVCLVTLFAARIFDTPTSSFLLAIIIASFVGSRTAGYLATLVTAVLFYTFFLRSPAPFIAHISPHSQLIAFLFVGCVIPELAEISRRIERRRARSELNLRTLVQTCPDALILLDSSANIVSLNPAARCLFGYEDGVLQGRHISMLLPRFSTGLSLCSDFEAVTADGRHLLVAATWSQLGDETSVFVRDVTERRQVESELRLLVESIPALVYIRDAHGSLRQVNHRVTDFNPVSLDQLQRDNGLSVVHPEDRHKIADLFKRQFPLGAAFSYEFRQLRFDGTYRWFDAKSQPLKNTMGEVVRWYTLLTDIDDRKMMEASLRGMQTKLAEASRISTVAEITASVVHEISQPLSAIISNSQACIRYLSADSVNLDQITNAVQRILRNGRDASQTVKNIRGLFCRRKPDVRPIDLRPIIEEVLLLHETQIRQSGIAVSVSVEDTLPTIHADKLQIQQVLANLVCNAIEAMGPASSSGGELEVRAYEEDRTVLISITDRGHGLTDPDKVFDPFFTTKETGMGMGLRISKTIVEAHEGRLWAAPRPDKGSTFTFSLPVERGSLQ
jgi:PAS domain S-box-containing protein